MLYKHYFLTLTHTYLKVDYKRLSKQRVGMGEKRNTFRTLIWKSLQKWPIWTQRRAWEDNIKMDHRDRRWMELTLLPECSRHEADHSPPLLPRLRMLLTLPPLHRKYSGSGA